MSHVKQNKIPMKRDHVAMGMGYEKHMHFAAYADDSIRLNYSSLNVSFISFFFLKMIL